MSSVSPSPAKSEDFVQSVTNKLVEVCTPKKGPPLPKEDVEKIEVIVNESFKSLNHRVKVQGTLIKELELANQELLQIIDQLGQDYANLKKRAEEEHNQSKLRQNKLQNDIHELLAKNLLAEVHRNENEELKKINSDLEVKYEEVKKGFDNFKTNHKELKLKYAQLEDVNSKFSGDLNKLESDKKQLIQDSDKWKKEYDLLVSQHTELKAESKKWSTNYCQLNERHQKLQKVVDEALAKKASNDQTLSGQFCAFVERNQTTLNVIGYILNPLTLTNLFRKDPS